MEKRGRERAMGGGKGDYTIPPKATCFICSRTPDAFIPMRECPALPSCMGREGGERGRREREG